MKAGGGKRKGAQFERKTCEALSLWVSKGKRDDLFWRSSMSGGRASVKFKKGKENVTQGGDICAIDPMGHKLLDRFSIECKHYNDLNITTSLVCGYGKLVTFWFQTVKQAKRQKKIPILIARQNRLPVLFITNRRGYEELDMDSVVRVSFVARLGKPTKYIAFFEDVVQKLQCP